MTGSYLVYVDRERKNIAVISTQDAEFVELMDELLARLLHDKGYSLTVKRTEIHGPEHQ
jgi:hypothetical protein